MYNEEPEIVEEIRAANQRFYDAFNELSIERMDEVWETSERAMCVHPGWSPIVGWDTIRESWVRIFDNANSHAVHGPLPERHCSGRVRLRHLR